MLPPEVLYHMLHFCPDHATVKNFFRAFPEYADWHHELKREHIRKVYVPDENGVYKWKQQWVPWP